MKIQIIIGSTRPGRVGDKIGQWVYSQLSKAQPEAEFELVDLLEFNLPLMNETIPPLGLQGKYTSEVGQKWADKIASADGYVIVTPEYNHSFPASLKNGLDYIGLQMAKKPVAFVSYSPLPSGGSRAVEQLIPVTVQLSTVTLNHPLNIANTMQLIDQQTGEVKADMYVEPAQKMAAEIVWWTKNLKKIRDEQ